MKKFSFSSVNNGGSKDMKKEDFYEGERILYKSEGIKLEDEFFYSKNIGLISNMN